MTSKWFLLFILSSVFIIQGCGNGDLISKSMLGSSRDILNQCRCSQYCYGEIYPIGCLYSSSVEPQNCIDFVGLKIAEGTYGGEDQYFTSPDGCFLSLISRQNTSQMCSLFPDNFEYQCFVTIGKKNLNPIECQNLPYEYKSDCYLYISEKDEGFDLSLCNELEHDHQITCYANKATLNNDSKVCLTLNDDTDKIDCYSQINEQFDPDFERGHYVPVYYDWFITAKLDTQLLNDSYCVFENNGDKVDETRRNDSCFIALAMIHQDFKECNNLPEDYLGINLIRKCIFFTSLWNHFELSECENLGANSKECKEGVVLSKRNPDLCSDIYITNEDKSHCIQKMAVDYYGVYGTKNIKLCESTKGDIQTDCIRQIYHEDDEEFQNEEMCSLLTNNPEFRTFGAKCYNKLALNTNNPVLCENIDDDFSQMKTECRERTSS